MNIHLKEFEELYVKSDKYPKFKVGDTIEVKTKVVEDGKTRIQTFQGVVIQRRHKNTNGETFTVRKLVGNVAVEKIFTLLSPIISNIEVIKYGVVRRARIFYLRKPEYKKKIKQKFISKKNKNNNIANNINHENPLNVEAKSDININENENANANVNQNIENKAVENS